MLWLVALLWGCSPDPALAVRWLDAPVEGLVNAHRFELVGTAPVPITVTCTREADPQEIHQLQGSSTHPLIVFGLLASDTYQCTLESPVHSDTRQLHTEALPPSLPTLSQIEGESDGYTLFNHGLDDPMDRQAKLVMVDPQGRIRWYFDRSWPAHDLDAQYLGDDRILTGGGYQIAPTRLRLDGTVEAQAIAPTTGRSYHHHAEQLPDGTVASLAVSTHEDGALRWDGFSIELLDHALTETLWAWNSTRGWEEGWLPTPTGDNHDPYHANALAIEDDAFYVSLQRLSQIVKIDRSTGERQWTLGLGGDFALLSADGAPAPDRDWFYNQHAPKVSGDRVLIHDNGKTRPGSPQETRVLELQLDVEAGTATELWRFTEPGWFEPIWGDADWLDNGNVLITRAHCDRCAGSVPEARTQILEVDPGTDEVVWRIVLSEPESTSYRAQRIDPCAVFHNQALCPR